MRIDKLLTILAALFLFPLVAAADVASLPADEFPACADALAHGNVAIVEDPTSLEYCPPGDDTGGGGAFPPHECICHWDGAVGTWILHSHSVIDNNLTINGVLKSVGTTNNFYVQVESSFVNGRTGFQMTNDARTWRISTDPNDSITIADATAGTFPVVVRAAAPTNSIHINTVGDVGFGTNAPNENLTLEGGVWSFLEASAPTATTNYGKIWTESNNELFFQDGDGTTHTLHGDAFGNLWHHGVSTATVTISTQNQATLIDSFSVVGGVDNLGNVTGSTSTNLLTVGANGGGAHDIGWHSSFTVGGGAKRTFIVLPGVVLASTNTVTAATETTPIVLTIGAHTYENGDMLEVVSVGGNTAANGTRIVQNAGATTVDLYDASGAAVASNGTYTSGGEITIFYSGELLAHENVSQSDPTVGGGGGPGIDVLLAASDAVGLYAINLESTNDLVIFQVSLGTERIGD